MVSACGIFSFMIWKKDKTKEQTALHLFGIGHTGDHIFYLRSFVVTSTCVLFPNSFYGKEIFTPP
jgi:hypothetical protein